ncbi:hypothetical protein SAMN05421805_12876 [Saccharopolyspora antimicrobica]|uniref:Uncharacterized protein n=1 Tax=Saccharopolyspora antimicrobica TaxID=455193 RepID=A0A1I5KZY9_9PSEU|nr:hypothetical protein [Saccharopolyspora antimicrobica]RKT89072.1 hypothetical protein ATL45_7518 [Saccharopolyspora antimicrobica]SFO90462.1 hypothetical protein SAMN05421805_12876 [Saccharopolyspora antimicrobica]
MYVFPFLAVALALLVLLALVVYGRLVVRNQRKALAALRQNGLAFLCRPTLGMLTFAGYLLSVDRDAVSLWKVGLGRPVRKQSFPSPGARVAPATVKINLARTSSGLSVISSAAERLDVVIYPDPTMSYSAPANGAFLDLVREKIQEHLAHTPRTSG